jgi:hypothetical protein
MPMIHLVRFKTIALAAIILGLAAVSPLTATGMPVDVTYVVTGSAGDYTLDFSVTNNLPAPSAVYLFGVQLSARDIVGSPAYYNPDSLLSVNNSSLGGSSINYNNIWLDPTNSGLNQGQGFTNSGFLVHLTDLTAPTSVLWTAYALTRPGYTGGGNFFNSTLGDNPRFEGVAQVQPVPLPAAVVLFGSGLVGLVGWQRKRLIKAA